MATYVSDAFQDTSATNLQSHTGETGATWTKHPTSTAANLQISDANRCRQDGTSTTTLYYASGVPATANYQVSAVHYRAGAGGATLGVCGRMDETAATFYHARYTSSGNVYQLFKFLAGTGSQLGSNADASGLGANGYGPTIYLVMSGSTIQLWTSDTSNPTPALRIAATDTDITAAGRAGLRNAVATTNSTGVHFDDFAAADITAGGSGGGHTNRLLMGVG